MSVIDLKRHLEEYGISPCKAKGQNFLWHALTLERIAQHVQSDEVLEIGPGPGTLTQFIWRSRPLKKLTLIEKDARFERLLTTLMPSAGLVVGDALEVDWTPYSPCMLVGNLPYNVSVPLVLKYLRTSHLFPEALFMFQKEVADRIMASPGSKAYGRLSVMAQAYATVKRVMNVPPSAFWPQPAIDSTVLLFKSRGPSPDRPSFDRLEKVVARAFQTRRKMIHHAFKEIKDWETFGLSPSMRAEDISVHTYCQMAGGLSVVTS